MEKKYKRQQRAIIIESMLVGMGVSCVIFLASVFIADWIMEHTVMDATRHYWEMAKNHEQMEPLLEEAGETGKGLFYLTVSAIFFCALFLSSIMSIGIGFIISMMMITLIRQNLLMQNGKKESKE